MEPDSGGADTALAPYDPLRTLAAEMENVLDGAGLQRTPRPRGRASKRNEILGFIAAAGLDSADYEHLLDSPAAIPEPEEPGWGERPDSIAEMRDAVLDLLWARIPTFKETALARTADMLTKLVTADLEPAPEPPPELDVLDLIETEGVLPERQLQLLGEEWTRGNDRQELILAAIQRIAGAMEENK